MPKKDVADDTGNLVGFSIRTRSDLLSFRGKSSSPEKHGALLLEQCLGNVTVTTERPVASENIYLHHSLIMY